MRGLLGIALLAFTVYCLVDAWRSETSKVRAMPKPLWMLLIVLAPLLGGVAWLLVGRPSNSPGSSGGGRRPPSRPPVVGPDDDPDFLRTINRPGPVTPAEPLKGQDDPPSSDDSGIDQNDQSDSSDDPSERDDRRP